MKSLLITILFLICSTSFVSAQKSAMEAWNVLLEKPQLAEYFSGIFDHLGIRVKETGEEFTVHHKGDHFTLTEGVKQENVDYYVELKQENIDNMVSHGDDEEIDDYESFRIMSVLFTPLTEASLKNPTMAKPLMRKMANIENHIHVVLLSPNSKETTSHTLIYLNKEWMVIPGLHGNAHRIFKLKPQDAIDYQRKVFEAIKLDSSKGWKSFKKWYIKWREGVSEDTC